MTGAAPPAAEAAPPATAPAETTVAVVVVDAAGPDGRAAAVLRCAPDAPGGLDEGGTLLAATLCRLRRAGVAVGAVLTRPGWVDDVRAVVGDGAGGPVQVLAAEDLATSLELMSGILGDVGRPRVPPGQGERVLVVPGELVLPDGAVAELVGDGRLSTAVATDTATGAADTGAGTAVDTDVSRDRPGPATLRTRGRRVVAAGSAMHAVAGANARSLGMVLVGAADRPAAAGALAAMGAAARANAWRGDPLDHLLVALVRSGPPVAAVDLAGWPAGRCTDPAGAARLCSRLAGLDEEQVRLRRALRANDGFYSTFVLRRLSRRLTPVALRLRLSPNQVTLGSAAAGLSAAACFAAGTRPARVAGALLLQASLVVDCVDGEVARYTRRFSDLGAWLDGSSDRVKEYAAYAGLAAGSARRGDPVWLPAAAALTLQTFRHMTDYNFALVQEDREGAVAPVPLDRLDAVGGAPAASGGMAASPTGWSSRGAVAFSERSNRTSAVRWAKRVVHMPIGERWLVVSATAALAGPRVTFAALRTLGAGALAYTGAGRTLRSASWRGTTSAATARRLATELDAGPLVRAVAGVVRAPGRVPARGRLRRAAPALLATGAAAPLAAAAAMDASPARRLLLLAGVATGTTLIGVALAGTPLPGPEPVDRDRPGSDPAGTDPAGTDPAGTDAADVLAGRFGWLVPALLRLVELGVLTRTVQVLAPDALAAAYALLFVVAYHHYDVLYRVLVGAAPARRLAGAGLGFDGRLLAVAALAAGAPRLLPAGLLVLAGELAAVFLVVHTVEQLRAFAPGAGRVARA